MTDAKRIELAMLRCKTRPEILEALREAANRTARLVELRAQRASWVRGQTGLPADLVNEVLEDCL